MDSVQPGNRATVQSITDASAYSRQDVAEAMEYMFSNLRQVRQDGQREYAHQDDNPFRNFQVLGWELTVTREQVAWVYLRKHMDSILAYVNGQTSQRETLEGRIKDAIMYLILLWCMDCECRGEKFTSAPVR